MELSGQPVVEIVIQSLSLLVVTEKQIGFFKLSSDGFVNSTSNCHVDDTKISQVKFLQQTPSIMFIHSKELNSILVYEATGKQKFICKEAGRIKFPDTHQIRDVAIQQTP